MTHVCACLWYLVTSVGWDTREHESNWLLVQQIEDASPWVQWTHCMYFIFTVFTTVGFGDIYPREVGEIWSTIILMLVGAVVNSIIVSEVIAVVSRHDDLQLKTDEKKRCVQSFMELVGLERDDMCRKLCHWTE